jgi:hypothetical protein
MDRQNSNVYLSTKNNSFSVFLFINFAKLFYTQVPSDMQLKKKQINKNTNLLLILISIFESRDSQFLLSLFFELFSLKQTNHRADCQASTNLERCGSNQKKKKKFVSAMKTQILDQL